jgi:hypothetical protein
MQSCFNLSTRNSTWLCVADKHLLVNIVWNVVFYECKGEVATTIEVAVARPAKYINRERDCHAPSAVATSVTSSIGPIH